MTGLDRFQRPLLRVLACVAALSALPAGAVDELAFAVIAGPDTPAQALDNADVARIFERKQTFWPDGQRIHPVNLPPTDPLRQRFSTAILGQAPEALVAYWRERYFHGVLPPHVLASENAVRLFVESTPGAIGYVSGCLPGAPLHTLLVVGHLPPCKP
jgi:hypothetical protein